MSEYHPPPGPDNRKKKETGKDGIAENRFPLWRAWDAMRAAMVQKRRRVNAYMLAGTRGRRIAAAPSRTAQIADSTDIRVSTQLAQP